MTFGFIGTGNMGGALARAAAKAVAPADVFLYNRTMEKAANLARELGAKTASAEDIAARCDYVFLGVKPGQIPALLASLRPVLEGRETPAVVVSMAAGVTLKALRDKTFETCPIIRIMPNTACAVGAGLTLYDCSEAVTETQLQGFLDGMASSGRMERLAENLIDAGSAVAGCGGAFACLFMEALADGAVSCGLPRDKANVYAAQMLRGGGRLVYSTCTFSPQENEGAVSAFLHAHPEFYVEEVSAPWFSPGRPEWVEDPAPGLEHTFRLWPHHLRGEGHYAAVLRKRGEDVSEQPEEKTGRFPTEFLEFQKASGAALPCGKPLLFGSTLYQMPDGTPELCGLKVLRAGLELGQLLRGRFEPAHAWALWLKDAKSVADLPSDSEAIRRYLAGEAISGIQTGWTLVRVDSLTLGWAKGSAGQLKNHYPKALRRG